MNGPTLLGGISALLILLTLFELLRRHRLREKYALIWVLVAVGLIVATLFPPVVAWSARLLGLQVPANLLFFVSSILLMVLTLHHSHELGRVEERTRTLAEELALLRLEVAEALAPRAHPDQPSAQDPPA